MTSIDPSATDPTGLRPTKQRLAVAEALRTYDGFHSAQEIHSRLDGAVGLATVYRTLTALAEAGAVDAMRSEDGETIYRRCSDTHHHHLVCRQCGRTVEVEGPAVERWADKVAAEHGFADISHTLEIFGTCAECQKAS